MSFEPGSIVGHIACPFCQAQVACTTNKKKNGNLYFMCDGRADPNGQGCMTRCFVGAGPSNNMKAAAMAATDPKEETENATDSQTDTVSTVQPEGEPGGQPEPVEQSADTTGTGDDAGDGDGDGGGTDLGFCQV